MQLVGFMDSPFVRRVAITARFLGQAYEHRELSIFRDVDEFRKFNPLVKVPTLVCDDGQTLVDSTLIIDYLESRAGRSLLPSGGADRVTALHIIGIALVAMEKVVQIIYETRQRPTELQHQPWIERVLQQLNGALDLLEAAVGDGSAWLVGREITQADISVAVGWRFVTHTLPEHVSADTYPGLRTFSSRAEALAEFRVCPLT
ncbi:MAG: glutathione S-transferase family protein [Woeseiaceae bacterium]